jgi:tRNA1Val (adenine37-N6)-methyltransferase
LDKYRVFYQPLDGYSYNSDTIYLYDFISQNCNLNKKSVLDVGSGCGVLGILLAKDYNLNLSAIELQEHMAFLSQKNSQTNDIKNNIINDNFLEFEFENKFDVIVSNPPFWDKNVVQTKNETVNISRYNQHLPIESFFEKVSKILSNKGYFLFCYDSKQLQKVLNYLSKWNLTVEQIRFIHPKNDKDSTIFMAKCRKNSKSFMKIDNPLIVFENNEFCEEVQEIYKKARTHTIKCQI